MAAEIRTREVIKGTIKTFDRGSAMAARTKDTYVKTKESMESARTADDSSPSSYATDNATQKVHFVAREGAYKANVIGKSRTEAARNEFIKTKSRVLQKRGLGGKQIKTAGFNVKRRKLSQSTYRFQMARRHAIRNIRAATVSVRGFRRIAFAIASVVKAAILGAKALLTAVIAGGWIAVIVVVICCLFGAAFYFFGDQSTSNYLPVSAEVEALEPEIKKIAAEYDMTDYVDLIKAVLMMEDEEKLKSSIEKNIRKLKAALDKAGATDPLDMGRIRLALSYMAPEDDEEYPDKVLRYYPFGSFSYDILYTGPGILGLPIEGMTQAHITSRFGLREAPGGIYSTNHKGLDIGYPTGTKIRACESGKVTTAGWVSGYGYCVIIDHGNGMVTLYAHMSKLHSMKGQHVLRGQVIGEVGNTGNSTGPHLHLEVRVNGKYMDPEKYVTIPK